MLSKLSLSIVKFLMKTFPAYPDPNDYSHWEIFKHKKYKHASIEKQNEIKLKAAIYRYYYESEICAIEKWFPIISLEELRGKSVLDLGCFTGGCLVYWKERYQLGETKGIDINPIFEEAGRLFSQQKGVDIEFRTGYGEDLPYESNCFDFIISYDVFEHVRDVEKVMKECFRVLRPEGTLLVIFPQYLQPLESHSLITKLHGLHWFFSGETITQATYDICAERGKDADWYALKSPYLEEWERLPALNGISLGRFRQLIRMNKWKIIYQNRKPILSTGRRSKEPLFRFLKLLFIIPSRLPFFEELFLDRVCFCLEKSY